jgi:serine/threonine-protein kinase
MAILTAVTVVGAAVLQQALQPEIAAAQRTPVFRLSALFLVLAGAALAALQRAGLVTPQDLLDLGLLFEVAGSCALALMENALPWADSAIRGSTIVAAWIAICAVVIPNRPWKSIAAAFASAAVVPCTHLVAAQILGYPALPWNRLFSYALGPVFVVGWTPFISTRIHRLHEDLSRTQNFGSYHLERLLGHGGMGEVWLARHRFLRREAAVKLVLAGALERAGVSERRQIQKRFEAEAQAIASLRSPHTVAIFDYGLAENGSLYYAMEYLPGLDAGSLVDQYGPQPAGRVISFLRQACESLEEAHDAGLVHRDIKPTNLFICRLGKSTDFVKVVDFGLVKDRTHDNRD